jgi:hypothetical protein
MREALMLGVKTYDLDYVTACQERLVTQDHLTDSAGSDVPDGAEAEVPAALTIELDAFFVHRVRAERQPHNPADP